MNTCVCMYVDYAWTYVPKHTCSCKSMGNLVGRYIFVHVTVYVFM